MQKGIRINSQVQKQLAKSSKGVRTKFQRKEWKAFLQSSGTNQQLKQQYYKEEREHRKEDWKLGPLAPNRDAGRQRGLLATVDVQFATPPRVPSYLTKDPQHRPKIAGYEFHDYEASPALKFKGKTIIGNILVGDRVCVIHGDEKIKGLVGYVKEVMDEQESVRITNINVVG